MITVFLVSQRVKDEKVGSLTLNVKDYINKSDLQDFDRLERTHFLCSIHKGQIIIPLVAQSFSFIEPFPRAITIYAAVLLRFIIQFNVLF